MVLSYFYTIFAWHLNANHRDLAQLVAHYVRDVGVGRSNRLIPTIHLFINNVCLFLSILQMNHKAKTTMIKDFFSLQKNDQQAILVLLGVILVCTSIIFFIGNSKEEDSHPSIQRKDSISAISLPTNAKEHLYYKVEGKIQELFTFDPNTADSTDFLKLGLQPWQIRSIYRYRAKGGIYRTATDFAKLYGLTKKQYEVLAPYIHIADDYRPAADFYGNNRIYPRNYQREGQTDSHNYTYGTNNNTGNSSENTRSIKENPRSYKEEKIFNYPHKLKTGQQISINHADTTEFMKIPGIGSYYAKRIIRYRELLGGFISARQVLDIEGIEESILPYIHIDLNGIKKMNINKLTLSQLRKHPYINFYQAKAIRDYRRLRGPINSLEDLKLSKDFPPAEIERLRPYVCF